jgi:topoisomerase IA-like protein
MADIYDLNKSITIMSEQEALQIILARRENRRIYKAKTKAKKKAAKKRAAAKKKKLPSRATLINKVKRMNPAKRAELIAQLEAMK